MNLSHVIATSYMNNGVVYSKQLDIDTTTDPVNGVWSTATTIQIPSGGVADQSFAPIASRYFRIKSDSTAGAWGGYNNSCFQVQLLSN